MLRNSRTTDDNDKTDSTPVRATDTTAKDVPYAGLLKFTIEQGMYPQKPTAPTEAFPSTGLNTEWKVQNGNSHRSMALLMMR